MRRDPRMASPATGTHSCRSVARGPTVAAGGPTVDLPPVAAVGTTLGGVGGDAFRELFDRIFMRAMVKDQIAGGSGFGVQEQKQALKQRLQAIIIKYTAQHVITLTEDGERGLRQGTHDGSPRPPATPRGSRGQGGGRRVRGRGRGA